MNSNDNSNNMNTINNNSNNNKNNINNMNTINNNHCTAYRGGFTAAASGFSCRCCAKLSNSSHPPALPG